MKTGPLPSIMMILGGILIGITPFVGTKEGFSTVDYWKIGGAIAIVIAGIVRIIWDAKMKNKEESK